MRDRKAVQEVAIGNGGSTGGWNNKAESRMVAIITGTIIKITNHNGGSRDSSCIPVSLSGLPESNQTVGNLPSHRKGYKRRNRNRICNFYSGSTEWGGIPTNNQRIKWSIPKSTGHSNSCIRGDKSNHRSWSRQRKCANWGWVFRYPRCT